MIFVFIGKNSPKYCSILSRAFGSLHISVLMSCLLLLSACTNTFTASQLAEKQEDNALPPKQDDSPVYLTADNGLFCLPYAANAESEQPALPPPPPSDLWQRIRDGIELDTKLDNRRITAQLNWYKRHPNYLSRVSQRSQRYMYYVVEQLEQRQLPLELALLPIVESAYDPFAYSHGRAAGMWQFIPGTARMYGLKQNWWYDGRRDVVASTDAALSYLSKLNKRFDGNWQHALAAYNSGEGTVARAIRNNRKAGRSTEFWALKLPKETRAYVPKLIALAKLLAEPEAYGVNWPAVDNKPYFKAVDIKSQIDLAQAATLTDIGIDEIYRLNPGFNRWATAPEGPHRLLVPFDKADAFETALANLPSDKRIGWKRYRIRSGDSLLLIAKRFDTQVDIIKKINSIQGNRIRAGKTLMVPIAQAPLDSYTLSAGQRLEKILSRKPSSKSNKRKINYKVRSGDSFWTISRKYDVGVRQLAKWNGMAPADLIRPGQTLTLWIPVNNVAKVSALPSMNRDSMIRKVAYKVRRGDSLARIADKFNVTISDIARWNTLNKSKYLQPGQAITLYVDVMNSY